jgi:hypothetical protein
MPLGRILPWPSGTVSAQPACATRAWPSLARLGLGQCSTRGPRLGPARPGAGASARDGAARMLCSGDFTGAREAARGKVRRGLTGSWMAVRPSSRA